LDKPDERDETASLAINGPKIPTCRAMKQMSQPLNLRRSPGETAKFGMDAVDAQANDGRLP
jgi:hypothetical protein